MHQKLWFDHVGSASPLEECLRKLRTGLLALLLLVGARSEMGPRDGSLRSTTSALFGPFPGWPLETLLQRSGP